MYNQQKSIRITTFRNRGIALLLLTLLSFTSIPSSSIAQQPTAKIKALNGNVLVSGRTATVGTILRNSDTIQTQRGAFATLLLSDGSEIQIGENTQLTIADLTRTSTGARFSRLTLIAGRLRAFLSPGHQQEGSSFTVDTPNAQIGAKFSSPHFEVYHLAEKRETIGIAHTVDLIAKNLDTGEIQLTPAGSSVRVLGTMIQIVPGIIDPASPVEVSQPATGFGTGKAILIGAGALVAAGGIAAATLIEDKSDESSNGYVEPTGRCDETLKAGSDAPETHVIELGKRSGSFLFDYQTYSIEDQLIVEYEGRVLFDTGCVGTGGWTSRRISYSGKSSQITVYIYPNCAGSSGTLWEFVVHCPM